MAKLAICRERSARRRPSCGRSRRWSKRRKLSRLVLAQLSIRAGAGVETRKWVTNVGFTTRAMLGAREQGRGCAEKEVGRGARSLENKRKKEAKHKHGSFEGKGKEEAMEKRKRPLFEEDNEAQKQ
jgi:hypothetical protein